MQLRIVVDRLELATESVRIVNSTEPHVSPYLSHYQTGQEDCAAPKSIASGRALLCTIFGRYLTLQAEFHTMRLQRPAILAAENAIQAPDLTMRLADNFIVQSHISDTVSALHSQRWTLICLTPLALRFSAPDTE